MMTSLRTAPIALLTMAWMLDGDVGVAHALVGPQVESLASPREVIGAYLSTGDQAQIFNGAGRLITISIADVSQKNWANSSFAAQQSRVFVLPAAGAILRIAMTHKAPGSSDLANGETEIKVLKYRLEPGARYQIVSTSVGELALMVHVTKGTAIPATEIH